MRNRWFHKPQLHSPLPGSEKKVTWLELFYDLIFVAAFIQLGNGLSKHPDLEGFLSFASIFVLLWVVWTGFTYFMNRFTIDDFLHRVLVFIQMFAVGAMAICAPQLMKGEYTLFAIAYAVAQIMVTIMYIRAWRQVPEARAYCVYWGGVFGAGGLIWLGSICVAWPWTYALWTLGVLCIFISPFSKQSRLLDERYPGDQEHIQERYGLLTLIVLGESFVKVLTGIGSGADLFPMIMQASLLLVLTCSIWWIYFDDVAGADIRGKRFTPIIWLYAHLPLQIGITATGVAIKKAVLIDNLMKPMKEEYRYLLSGTIALTVLSVALIDSVTERKQAELSDKARVGVRIFAGILLLVLAPAGSAMSAQSFLILVAVVCLSQVIFDMVMAPFEDMEHAREVVDADPAEMQYYREGRKGNTRREMAKIVRKGTPNELRRDLYFYFMEGGWFRFIVSMLFVFFMANVLFAALYVIQPGCIDNTSPDSFADAFFFSVQTMSTIGYGTMSPVTRYGHNIVTIEAAFSILAVAMATGLMFAKASRPSSSVLFSEPLVLTKRNGIPTLMFRVGNARGNEIIDATIRVSVVMDEMSEEGHFLNKIHDLKLVRNNSPVFTLSLTVMHQVTEDSPLFGFDWDNPSSLKLMVATLMGHDGTYNQTVHSRHNYLPEDVQHDHHFVDIVEELTDGRLLIDFDRFHDTVPLESAKVI